MDGWDTIVEILPFLIPLLILQLVLMIIAIVELIKRQKVRGDSKVLWALMI